MTAWLVASDAPIRVEDFPTVGKPTAISNLHSATSAVEITYQPDAPIAKTERLEVTGSEVEWTPARPGIVKIVAIAGNDGGTVAAVERSVQFDGVPAFGVAICLVAALLLFGGATWSLRLLLRGDGDD